MSIPYNILTMILGRSIRKTAAEYPPKKANQPTTPIFGNKENKQQYLPETTEAQLHRKASNTPETVSIATKAGSIQKSTPYFLPQDPEERLPEAPVKQQPETLRFTHNQRSKAFTETSFEQQDASNPKDNIDEHEPVIVKKIQMNSLYLSVPAANTSESEFAPKKPYSFQLAAGDEISTSDSFSQQTQPRIEAVKISGISEIATSQATQPTDLTPEVSSAKSQQFSQTKKKEVDAFENLMDQPPDAPESDHDEPTTSTSRPKEGEYQPAENVSDQNPETQQPNPGQPINNSALQQAGTHQSNTSQSSSALTQRADERDSLKVSAKNPGKMHTQSIDSLRENPEPALPGINSENSHTAKGFATSNAATNSQTSPAITLTPNKHKAGPSIKKHENPTAENDNNDKTNRPTSLHHTDTLIASIKRDASKSLSVPTADTKHHTSTNPSQEKGRTGVSVGQPQTLVRHPETSVLNARQHVLHKEIDKLQAQTPTTQEKKPPEKKPEKISAVPLNEAVSGNVLLQKMFVSPTTVINQPDQNIDRFEQLSRLVETIRVATPRLAGQGEVHLVMKEGVWKDTTIQLKLSGNQLLIDVITTTDNTRLLAAHKDRLIQQLTEACPGLKPTVSITPGHDDLPDGRSRQQYLMEQEEDEL